MSPRVSHLTCALALTLALAGVGRAQQSVPVTPVASGAHAHGLSAGTHVVRSQHELTQGGFDALLPPNALLQFDWSQEMLLVALMGTQSSGGYAIHIVSAELRAMATIQPVPTPPPSFELVVSVRRTRPGPGDIVTMALTAPYQVVRVPRHDGPVSFVDVPAATPFRTLRRGVGSVIRGRSISVAADGATEVVIRNSPTTTPETHRGRAEAGELNRLQRALADVAIYGLPDDLDGPGPMPMGAPVLSIQLEGGPQGDKRVSGTTPMIPAATLARLEPLTRALDALEERIVRESTAGFTRISLTVVLRPAIDNATTTTRIEQGGQVQVLRSSVQGGVTVAQPPLQGQATADELRRLGQALSAARLATLPHQLPTPVYILPGDTFALRVESASAENRNDVAGDPGVLDSYEAQLRPFLDAIQAVSQRLIDEASLEEVKGIVRRVGTDLVLVEGPQRRFRLRGPLVQDLARCVGLQVRVEGLVTIPSAMGGTPTLEVRRLISPTHEADVQAVVHLDAAGAPRLTLAGAAADIPARGRASRALSLANHEAVKLEAWIFRDAAGAPLEALVESVAGEAVRSSSLRRGGWVTGFVRRGEALRVLGLNASGSSALVRGPHGTGYVDVSRIDVGSGPIPTSPSPGLSGSLPGAGH